jgi:hypothetical protein
MLGADPSLSLDDVLPASMPARVFEPRIGADEAAERLARYRAVIG